MFNLFLEKKKSSPGVQGTRRGHSILGAKQGFYRYPIFKFPMLLKHFRQIYLSYGVWPYVQALIGENKSPLLPPSPEVQRAGQGGAYIGVKWGLLQRYPIFTFLISSFLKIPILGGLEPLQSAAPGYETVVDTGSPRFTWIHFTRALKILRKVFWSCNSSV